MVHNPQRSFYCADTEWDELRHAAIDNGVSASTLVAALVAEWLQNRDAEWAKIVAQRAKKAEIRPKRPRREL